MQLDIPIQILDHGTGLDVPVHATDGSAGLDLRAAIDEKITLKPGERYLIPCGFSMALSKGFEAQIRPRSGLALKHGLSVLNTPGTVDSDYRGEIKVLLINHGQEDFVVERGMRIAQMVIAKHEQVQFHTVPDIQTVEDTGLRDSFGFGSTGLK